MADSVNVTQGVGTKMAADEIAGVYHPRVKVEFGENGTATDVSTTNPMPVTSSPAGLTLGGRVSIVDVNDTSWTALPAVPLSQRNELNIQNESGADIKVNYDSFDPLPSGYVGLLIANGNERQYPIRDTVIIYAKAAPGSGTVSLTVEELA